MANDLINYAYVMKPPKEKKKAEGLGSESLWVGEHLKVRERRPLELQAPSTYLSLCISNNDI